MIKTLTFIKINWISFTLAILAVITALSLWPLEKLPDVPGSDKTHHFIAYAVLTFPTALRKPKKWKFIGLFFIVYSGVIELLQPLVNRHGELLDMAANATGVACGLLFAEVIIYILPALSNRRQ